MVGPLTWTIWSLCVGITTGSSTPTDWQITHSDGRFIFRKPDHTPYPAPRPALDSRLADLTRPTQRQ